LDVGSDTKKTRNLAQISCFFVSEGAYAPSLAPLRRRGARRPLRTPNGIGTKFRSRILGTLDSLGGGILGILSGDSGGGPSLDRGYPRSGGNSPEPRGDPQGRGGVASRDLRSKGGTPEGDPWGP
jgi:hypothetical protein